MTEPICQSDYGANGDVVEAGIVRVTFCQRRVLNDASGLLENQTDNHASEIRKREDGFRIELC
jgi:hypothetical protein